MKRRLSISTRCLKGTVSPPIRTPQELRAFLNSPTWRVHDLVPEVKDAPVGAKVDKILRMSGFPTNVSEEARGRIEDALRTQIAFIEDLYDDNEVHPPTCDNASVFRLLASDHHPPQPLTLAALEQQVTEIGERVSSERGELGFDTLLLRHKIPINKR